MEAKLTIEQLQFILESTERLIDNTRKRRELHMTMRDDATKQLTEDIYFMKKSTTESQAEETHNRLSLVINDLYNSVCNIIRCDNELMELARESDEYSARLTAYNNFKQSAKSKP